MGSYYDFVKVLDFGLVKLETHAAKPEPGLTAPELLTGTPAYLAPENALGELVDQRTDIYALGCVAYWMLTGRLVFDGDSPLQIVARHIHASPEPPSRYSAFPFSADLEKLVLDCLAKRPEDRPTTIGDLSSVWPNARSSRHGRGLPPGNGGRRTLISMRRWPDHTLQSPTVG